MDRKSFLNLLPFFGGLNLLPPASAAKAQKSFSEPSSLQPGETIGICCAGGYAGAEDIAAARLKFEEWGFNVKQGSTIGKRDFSFGGTDDERRADIQQMLDDDKVKALIFARGGYGAARVIDQLDFSHFLKVPKWIIGFSDATVFHCHLNSRFQSATIHAKMCNSFPSNWDDADAAQRDSINLIRDCLSGKKMTYNIPFHEENRQGIAEGRLVGGNLRTIENMSGTRSEIDTRDAILFIEDAGEYLYGIDRMLGNLQRGGKFDGLKGLIVGGFRIKRDDQGEEFGRTLQQIVFEKIGSRNIPVCFEFPVGHQKHNVPLKCGVIHELHVSSSGTFLKEI